MTLRLTLGVGLIAGIAYGAHSWGTYHWPRPTGAQVLVRLGDNLNTTWDPHLAMASNDWTGSSVIDTTIVTGSARASTCRPTSGRVEVCNYRYGNNGWLGIAQIWISGSHITQGVVKLNDFYFGQAYYNKPAWRQLVTCQEVGHTFGLAHQDENTTNANLGSCMDYTSSPDSNQRPNLHDYQQLEAIYNHTDGTTTTSSAPASSGQVTDHPSTWGRLNAASRNGLAEDYELDLGGGNLVLTHVTWASQEEKARGKK